MSNETVLIDQFFRQFQQDRINQLPEDVAFELFTLSLIFKSKDLDDDEISEGRIGGSRDGGIDGVFTFLNDELQNEYSEALKDDYRVSKLQKNKTDLDLWIVQSKSETGFKEDVFDKVRASTEKLLQLEHDYGEMNYSADLVSRFEIFTKLWGKAAERYPNIKINFIYAARGNTNDVSRGVQQKQKDLKENLEKLVPGSDVNIQLMGARELWELASATTEQDLQLRFREYISQDESYTGLVALPDYFSFLSNEDGSLRNEIFDSNVRDFQGNNVTVNQQIKKTLETNDSNDFWWFNNGVTILCNDVNIGGDKIFTLSGPQIVNGMQTSQSIYEALLNKQYYKINRKKALQVKIVKSNDEKTRDRIIRATNSQTQVPDASLRATEEIQRQIEDYFRDKGWFYERRKDFYKNQGKPSKRIVSILKLAQAMMAIGLIKPDVARARPTTLLKEEDDYKQIFNNKLDLSIYLWVTKFQLLVDEMLINSKMLPKAASRTNVRFYVSNFLVTKELGEKVHNPNQLQILVQKDFTVTDSSFKDALNIVICKLRELSKERSWQLDRTSKNREFAELIMKEALRKS